MKDFNKKVDVIVQTYGKNWQLACTIESLMTHSEKWIDKIYLSEESIHPFNDKITTVFEYDYPIIHKKLKKFINIYQTKSCDIPIENIRHQWGIENSDKEWVFIMHNDVLFTGDIIGNMLLEIDNFKESNPNEKLAGISEIGQCWNCPYLEMCGGGEYWNNWNPSYEDLLTVKLPHIRTRIEGLDKEHPKLVPECRLNEWSCLINRKLCIKHPTPHFGDFDEDSGTQWFKAMYKRGYKFIDYRKDFKHGYFSPDASGYNDQQVEERYWKSEEKAKKYFKENYE